MGWESRGGKHLYYTRSRRVNGRLVREYFGRGERAKQAAREDRQRQLERQERERIRATELTPWDTICRAAEQYHHAVEIIYRAILHCEGYHYHRGEWRKRRNWTYRLPPGDYPSIQRSQPTGTQRPDAADESRTGRAPQQQQLAAAQGEPRRRPVPPTLPFKYSGCFVRNGWRPAVCFNPTRPGGADIVGQGNHYGSVKKKQRPASLGSRDDADEPSRSPGRGQPDHSHDEGPSVGNGTQPRPPPPED